MRAGLTQEMLAERAGLGTRSIQGVERGERRPHRETVRRLADALGLEGADRSELEDAARPVPRPGGIVQVPELSTARPDERWPSREVGRSLPVYLTTFVGREAEGAAVIGLLAGTRLLTLTGTGGCGKTRLAVHLAGALAGAYPTGVRFVDLASLADPSLVPAAVLAALGLREVPGRAPAAAVAAHLRGRAALLLLDNCEHLVEACARLAEALLAACPGLRVLATSREPLGVAGETVWRVPSLPTPWLGEAPALDRLAAYPSVRLFMDRASAIAPPFALTVATASAVARVCRRLDGVPLALELAASRVRVLTPEQIAARLDDRFGLLTGGSRTAPPRQQTLRATLDWSHDLLAEAERALVRRLSVFAGGWTIEAAEEVCSGAPASGHPIRADDVLDLLTALVDKSLVLAEVRAGAGRYRLLETVRQYAAERLAAAGETEVTRRCQRAWCLALAERARRPARPGAACLDGPVGNRTRQPARRAGLEPRGPGGRGDDPAAGRGAGGLLAQRRARGGGPALARSGAGPIGRRGPPRARAGADRDRGARDRRRRSRARRCQPQRGARAVQGGGDRSGAAEALRWLGVVAFGRADYAAARRDLEESLALAREVADGWLSAWALAWLGVTARDQGDYAAAEACLRESLAFFRASGDTGRIATQLAHLGDAARLQGHDAVAGRLLEEALGLFRAARDQLGIGWALAGLGAVVTHQGDRAAARTLLDESVAIVRQTGETWVLADVLRFRGALARADGELALARAAYGESLRLSRARADRQTMIDTLDALAGLAATEGHAVRAARLFGAAEAGRERIGRTVPPVERAPRSRDLEAARSGSTGAHFRAAWEAGRAATLEHAVADALDEGTDPNSAEPSPHRGRV